MTEPARLYSPTGVLVVSTLERVYGEALVMGATGVDPETGLFDLEYAGETLIDWDSQESVLEGLERVFIDDDGEYWSESQLELRQSSVEE